MKNLNYSELEMQEYLKEEKISTKQARILFKFRTRMIQCWGNFKGGRPPQQCPVCREPSSEDDQEHMMECKVLKERGITVKNYSDIFRKDIDETIVRTLVHK